MRDAFTTRVAPPHIVTYVSDWHLLYTRQNTWVYTDSGYGGQTKDLDGDEVDGYDGGNILTSEIIKYS